MITPPLDFKNAASKLFTFRVMGDFMYEGHQTNLEVYYIDKMGNEPLYFGKIDVPIPDSEDLNGEWSEFHMDLTEQNIADIFFIGFKFSGPSGAEATTYYIDDVSWGKTDVPMMSADITQIVMQAEQDIEKLSGIVTVKTQNLINPITLTLTGSNASKFKLSTNTLPIGGGQFYIAFLSELIGVHQAYIKMSSQGAADKYIPIVVNNTLPSSINNPDDINNLQISKQNGYLVVQVEEFEKMTLYDINGKLMQETNQPRIAIQQWPQNTYILQVKTKTNTQIVKILNTPIQ